MPLVLVTSIASLSLYPGTLCVVKNNQYGVHALYEDFKLKLTTNISHAFSTVFEYFLNHDLELRIMW